MLRHILHDWGDEECVRILRYVLDSMKAGARIIVIEQVLNSSEATGSQTDQIARALDMQILVQFGGKERTLPEWEALFRLAEPTLEIVNYSKPSGSADTIMELQKSHLCSAEE